MAMTDTSSPLTAADRLRLHREVWDMPTLADKHPEVLEHLAARYEVHFGMIRSVSDVVVVHRSTGASEDMHTSDVRVAVEALLVREAEER